MCNCRGLLLVLLLMLCQPAAAQNNKRVQQDSAVAPPKASRFYEQKLVVIEQGDSLAMLDRPEPTPITAALYSAVFPGLGQAFNGSYWKIPILYGGFATLGYFINFNNTYYQLFRESLFIVADGNPDNDDQNLFPNADQERLNRRVDYWRRNRDYLIIITAVLYMANIAEAHVDAHLKGFDVSESLTLRVQPALIPDLRPNSYNPGINICLSLK